METGFYTEQEIRNELRRKAVAGCYLIFGQDGYLKSGLVRAITDATTGADDCFNYHPFGYDAPLQEVTAARFQLPLMAQRSLVILKDFDINAMDAEATGTLVALMEEGNDTSTFVLWCDRVEPDTKKASFKALTEAVNKAGGRVVQADHRSVGQLASMLCEGAKKRGCTMDPATARFLTEYVSEDIELLQSELTKLCAFAQGGTITEETVKTVCVPSIRQSVFDLSDRILQGNVTAAVTVLDNLLFMRTKPLIIAGTIAHFYVELARAKAGEIQGIPLPEAAKTFGYGNRVFAFERASKKARRLSTVQILKSLTVLGETDAALKRFSGDERILLEQLIVRLSGIAVKEADLA